MVNRICRRAYSQLPPTHRVQRVYLVAQHEVFDMSSAAMAEDFHGVKSFLPNDSHYHHLIPQLPTL